MNLNEAKQILNDNGYYLTESAAANRKLAFKSNGEFSKFGSWITTLAREKGKVNIQDGVYLGVYKGKFKLEYIAWLVEGYQYFVTNKSLLKKYVGKGLSWSELNKITNQVYDNGYDDEANTKSMYPMYVIRDFNDKLSNFEFDGSERDFLNYMHVTQPRLDGFSRSISDFVQACQFIAQEKPEYEVNKTKPLNQSTIAYVGSTDEDVEDDL